jgi:TolB-like protein/Flp pilus assembly protein TadD
MAFSDLRYIRNWAATGESFGQRRPEVVKPIRKRSKKFQIASEAGETGAEAMPKTYEFGPFRLDGEAEILYRGAEPVAVGQRAVALLRVLVEQAGTPVAKQALIESAWPGLAVEDSNLTVQIAALRRAFAAEPDGERWIETLPRRGYRFVGPTGASTAQRDLPADETTESNAEPTLPLPDKPSIAVLPFENLSGDREQEYFADGLADDIITSLSKFQWFFVIARNSSFTYKAQPVDVEQVSRELGVQYVLEGSVRKAGHRVRVTAQLIDALTGRHVWAQRYDRDLEDIFAVQDELTEAIVAAVAPSFITAEARRVGRKPPDNFDAWDYVLRGNWFLAHWGKEDNAEAARLFEKALQINPRSTAALNGMAYALIRTIAFGWADDVDRARAAALAIGQQAVAQDPQDAEAHVALGRGCYAAQQLDAAAAAYREALRLNPNLGAAEGHLAHVLSLKGEYDEALVHVERAARLSPHDPTHSWWGLTRTSIEFGTANYEAAVEWAKKTIELTPESPPAWRYLAASLAHLNRMEEARAAKAQLLHIMPYHNLRHVRAAFSKADLDRTERFIEGLRKAGVPE